MATTRQTLARRPFGWAHLTRFRPRRKLFVRPPTAQKDGQAPPSTSLGDPMRGGPRHRTKDDPHPPDARLPRLAVRLARRLREQRARCHLAAPLRAARPARGGSTGLAVRPHPRRAARAARTGLL